MPRIILLSSWKHLSTLTHWLGLSLNCSFNLQNGRRTLHKGPLSLQTSHLQTPLFSRLYFLLSHLTPKVASCIEKKTKTEASQWQWSLPSLQEKGSQLKQTELVKKSLSSERPQPWTKTSNHILSTFVPILNSPVYINPGLFTAQCLLLLLYESL